MGNFQPERPAGSKSLRAVEKKTVSKPSLSACDLHGVDYDFGMHENELFEIIGKGDADAMATLLDDEPSLLNSRQNGVTPTG